MPVLGLDHVNIHGTASLVERCRSFYVEVLGLTEGPRPPFQSQGFWLYAGDRAIVHLTVNGGERGITMNALDHFAFNCTDLDAMMTLLHDYGIPFELDPARDAKNAQLFLHDPAGVALELNFV